METQNSNQQPIQPMPPVEQPPAQIMNIPEENNHHTYRMIIVTVFVLFIAVVGFLVARNTSIFNQAKNTDQPAIQTNTSTNNTLPTATPVIPTVAPAVDTNKAWLKIDTADGKKEFAVGDTINLVVSGFSAGNDIRGFDIVMSYDSEVVEINRKQVSSLARTFTVYATSTSSNLTITGVKDSNITVPVTIAGDALFQIPAVAKKSGKVTFALIPLFKQDQTKFVNTQVQDVIPQLQSVQVEIK